MSHDAATFADINAIKADFNDVYRRRDPRAYYEVLGALDYVIPEVACPIFAQLVERCVIERGRPITVLDIGCSYGVNAALLRHDITLRQLRERYLSPSVQALSPDQVAEYDGRFYSGWPARTDVQFIGLDISSEAIAYALEAGLLNDGAATDLETEPLDDRTRSLIARADLVISTGCVGYITHATFEKVMEASGQSHEKPWIASFVLRMFDYDKIARGLARHALVTEKLNSATFVQRRFRDWTEQEQTISMLDARGVDPTGREADGLLHAELFVSRPEESVTATTLSEIVWLTYGVALPLGDRQRLPQSRKNEAAARHAPPTAASLAYDSLYTTAQT
ncbi:class I SAM-dependent methyltransferase [Methylosinus sp. KRF6]|uniref:class I SAM-dependent methyltransferase n=1 Tax=Methylosinus sp. KRF6 TaxID=2846853 RepID=UPI001C0C0CE1|nr:class I SAM-dependent methyltransferase [Methylosinus sp. KRF6]MBU3888510.1 class I SAM-dependent methyltransferase [Methylosinus sp. KRF6]